MSVFRAWGPVLPYALLILVLSLLPSSESKGHIFGLDKLYHALAYAVMGWLLMRGFVYSRPGWKTPAALAAFLAASVFGGFMEFLQAAATETRTADVYDALANAVGAASGSLAYLSARSRRGASGTSPGMRGREGSPE
jgi:VanZ family protein